MADVFEDRRDLDVHRERLWKLIAATPKLDWLLLTKRPQRVNALTPYGTNWPDNVWLGSTAENQKWLDKRMGELSSTYAKILFLSCEPLLGPLDLSRWIAEARTGGARKLDWLIAGGESGGRARPTNPEWFTSLRDQCVHAGVRFHFKQWGNWHPVGEKLPAKRKLKTMFLSSGDKIVLANVRKKEAGRELEGITWDEFPIPSF